MEATRLTVFNQSANQNLMDKDGFQQSHVIYIRDVTERSGKQLQNGDVLFLVSFFERWFPIEIKSRKCSNDSESSGKSFDK